MNFTRDKSLPDGPDFLTEQTDIITFVVKKYEFRENQTMFYFDTRQEISYLETTKIVNSDNCIQMCCDKLGIENKYKKDIKTLPIINTHHKNIFLKNSYGMLVSFVILPDQNKFGVWLKSIKKENQYQNENINEDMMKEAYQAWYDAEYADE